MTTFQFDQCFNDKKVIQACNDEGLAAAQRLPPDLHGKEDPELLAILMARAHPFVTLDRALPGEHTSHIPKSNPGIVIVNYSRDVLRTITTKEAAKILRGFKSRVTTWHQMSVRNSVVEITEKSVEVWHVEGGELIRDDYIPFMDDANWIEQLLRILNKNAQWPALLSPSLRPPSAEEDH